MNRIGCAFLAAVLAAGTAGVCQAAPVDSVEVTELQQEPRRTSIEVSGQVPSQKKGEAVTATLYYPENAGEQTMPFAGVAETKSVSGGGYTLTLLLPASVPTGEYTLKISADSMEAPETRMLTVVAINARGDLMKAVNEAESAAAVKEKIAAVYDMEQYQLKVSCITAILNENFVFERIYETKEKAPFTDYGAFSGMFRKFAVLGALNQGKNVDLQEAVTLFDELEEPFRSDYGQKLNDAGRKACAALLSGKGYREAEEFAAGFREAVVLARFSYADRYGYQHCLDAFADYRAFLKEQGFDFAKYDGNEDAVARNMTGTYSSMEALRKAYQNALARLNGGGNSNSGSRPSGGGTSGGRVTQTVTGPTEPVGNEPLEDIKPEDKPGEFTDMAGSEWAQEAVAYLAAKGVIQGKGGGIFEPEANVTREEFVKILVLAFGIDAGTGGFTDVAYSHWAYPYLSAAKQCGIVLGREDGSFGLGEPITREDAAAMLCRACKAAALELTNRQESAVFADQTEISAYAAEAVAVLSGAGIVNGMEGNRFGPKENTTRAQAAKMVYEVKMTAEDKEAAK